MEGKQIDHGDASILITDEEKHAVTQEFVPAILYLLPEAARVDVMQLSGYHTGE
jgi:hypothetical protein